LIKVYITWESRMRPPGRYDTRIYMLVVQVYGRWCRSG